MSATVLRVAADLSAMRLIGPSGSDTWEAPPFVGDEAPGAEQWRERARLGAAWVAQQRAVRRRIGAVVVDTDESVCMWVRSASLATPVLSATVRRLSEEWGESAALWSVEPVYAPSDAHAVTDGEHALSVVCHHDALLRLLLDALDRRGINPACVMSDWHALTMLAPEGPGLTCVVARDRADRLSWAWADADGLLAGGSAACGDLEDPEASAGAIRRMALDWMTWSSQLGCSPERAVFVGAGSDGLSQAWRDAYPGRPVSTQPTDDVHGHLLGAVSRGAEGAHAEALARTTRRCLGRVSNRPTRRTRKRYQFAAAAALLACVAIGSVAFRMMRMTGDWREQANQSRADARALIDETWPGRLEGRPSSLATEARRLYGEEQREVQEGPQLPQRPKPIFEEALRVASLLFDVSEGLPPEVAGEGVVNPVRLSAHANAFQLSDTSGMLHLQVPEREVGTQIQQLLNAEDALMRWSLFASSNDSTILNFRGTWQ